MDFVPYCLGITCIIVFSTCDLFSVTLRTELERNDYEIGLKLDKRSAIVVVSTLNSQFVALIFYAEVGQTEMISKVIIRELKLDIVRYYNMQYQIP